MTRHPAVTASADELAIVGTPVHCVERLQALVALGVYRVIVIGPSAGSDRDEAALAERLLAKEVLRAYRARPN